MLHVDNRVRLLFFFQLPSGEVERELRPLLFLITYPPKKTPHVFMPHTPTNTALRGTTALIRKHEKLKLHLEVFFFFFFCCSWNQSVLSALLLVGRLIQLRPYRGDALQSAPRAPAAESRGAVIRTSPGPFIPAQEPQRLQFTLCYSLHLPPLPTSQQ